MMRLYVRSLVGDRRVLSGAGLGRRLLAAFVANAPPTTNPKAAFLDFEGIEVATSSFLRESVIAFRDYTRISLENLYPVVANANDAVREELEFLMRHRRDAIWCCTLNESGLPSEAHVLGELDPVERITFDLVTKLGSASAPALAAWSEAPGIGPTAWNNRLAALAARGLVVGRRAGRSKTFSPVLEMP